MTREFVYTRTFFNNWKAVGLNDDDLARFETMLLENPKMGAVIQGTGRARKVRFAYSGEGKSGSVRVFSLILKLGRKFAA